MDFPYTNDDSFRFPLIDSRPLIDPLARERSTILKLGVALKYLVAKDRMEHGPHESAEVVPTGPAPLCLRSDTRLRSNEWQPILSLDSILKREPLIVDRRTNSPCSRETQLHMHENAPRETDLPLLLEDRYEIQGTEARSVFGFAIHQQQIPYTFVFRKPDHPWFDDLFGLRRTAYITMKTQLGETRELHLKGSRDSCYLLGYLCKREDIIQSAKNAVEATLVNRKLPLVLDLDDTLVRLIGDGNDRHVPEADAYKYCDRVATLSDGKKIVLAEDVHEFLDWAQNFFDISVCSLGDQQYVESVINVLDPNRNRICGIKYSARSEHDYIQRSHNTRRAPKDLKALYPFSTLPNDSLGAGYTLPLIVDDETRMWPADQHDNIIVVKNQSSNPLWNVRLFPVVKETLSYIRQEFFKQLDQWKPRKLEAEQAGTVCSRPQPSAVGIYKTMLRSMLRDRVAAS